MTDKVWLTDAEVSTRFGTTRQWVVKQDTFPLKLTDRWSRWAVQEREWFISETTLCGQGPRSRLCAGHNAAPFVTLKRALRSSALR